MVILTSFPPPTEGIKLHLPNTEVHIGNRHLGSGTLFISESRLSWVGNGGQGFSLEYPSISIHAVSRDHRAYPQECLYLMVDAKLDETDNTQPQDGQEDTDEDDITEIRFIPEDRGVLDALFHAMSECQALHPDPEELSDDDEDEEYEEEEEQSCENSEALQHNGGTTEDGSECAERTSTEEDQMDTSQFEDADMK